VEDFFMNMFAFQEFWVNHGLLDYLNRENRVALYHFNDSISQLSKIKLPHQNRPI
jgi:hypothetical protein